MPRPGLRSPQPHRWGAAFGWTVISQFLLGGTRMILLIIVGRFLGKEALGQTSALLSLATFLVMLWPQAIGVAAGKFLAVVKQSRHNDAVASFATTNSLLVGVALGLAATLWSHGIFETPVETSVSVGLLVVALATSAAVRGIRNGRGELARATYGDIAGSVLGLTLMAIVVGAGLESLVLLPVAVSFLPGVVTGWPRSHPTILVEQRAALLHFTAWTSIHILAASSMLPLLMILTAMTTSRSSLGDFAAAASFATPAFLLSLASRSALEPFVAAHFAGQHERASNELVDALFRGMVVVFVPLFGVAVIWADQVLVTLYSPSYASGAQMLVLLLIAVGVNSINASHVWLSSTHSWGARVLAACNVVGLVAGIGTALVAVFPLGPTGAALGMLIGAVVSTFSTTAIVWRRCRMAWSGVITRASCGSALILAVQVSPIHEDLTARLYATLAFVFVWCLVANLDGRRATVLSRLVRPIS